MSFKSQSIDFVSYQSGDGSLVIDLSNDAGIIVTDEDGGGGIYGENAATIPTITEGTSDISSQFKWSTKSDDDDLVYEFDDSTRKCQVKELNKDSGVVTFTATHEGTGLTMTKSFKVSKLKAGSAGTSYWVSSSLSSIAKKQDGSFRDSSITFTANTKSKEGGVQRYITKLEIFVDNESTAIATTMETGECTVYLGTKPENAESGKVYCTPDIKLTCRMYFVNSSDPSGYYPSVYDEEGIPVLWDGENGQDGALIEYCYLLTDMETEFGEGKTPIPYWKLNEEKDELEVFLPRIEDKGWEWTDSPVGISESHKYEYMTRSIRENNEWSEFSTPVIWSKWGDRGRDGDGIEYRFCLMPDDTIQPEYPAPENVEYKWTDEPSGVSSEFRCEYVVLLKVTTNENGEVVYIPTPDKNGKTYGKLWSRWGEDGVSVRIKGTLELEEGQTPEEALAKIDDPHISDGYIINNELWVYSEAGWINGGSFAGESSYLHIKYATYEDGQYVFTGSVEEGNLGEVPGPYLGIYVDNIKEDSTNVNDYTWTKWEAVSPPMSPTESTITVYQKTYEYKVPDIGVSAEVEADGKDWKEGIWSEIKFAATYEKDKSVFIYKCQVNKKITYEGTTPQTVTYTKWGFPELLEAYEKNSAVSGETWATFLKLTQNKSDTGLYYDGQGKLYIDASFINTGALRVGGTVNNNGEIIDPIFSADFKEQKVNIGGFEVGKIRMNGSSSDILSFYYNLSTVGTSTPGEYEYKLNNRSFLLAPYGTKVEADYFETNETWKMLIGRNFGVTAQGKIYAKNAVLSGIITAGAGSNIAGWETQENIFGKISETSVTINGNTYYYGIGLSAKPNDYKNGLNVFAIGALGTDSNGNPSLNGAWSQAGFRVTGKGKLYATDAEISGILKSGAGSSLGGWTVSTPNGYVFGSMSTQQDATTKQYYGIGFDTNAIGTANKAFAIGPLAGIGESSSWANAAFYVTGKGEAYAKILNSDEIKMYCSDAILNSDCTNEDIGFNTGDDPAGYYKGITGYIKVMTGGLSYINLYVCNGIIVGVGYKAGT